MPHHHHHHQEHHAQRLSRSPSWWERSIVKRSTYAIDNLVDTMMAESSFLQKESSSSSSSEILVLDRSQVQLGAMLGKGSFSVVSEVTGLNLDDSEDNKDKADTDASGPQDEEHHDGIGNSSASSGDLCLQSMLSHLVEDDDYDDDEEDDPIRHPYHHHSGNRKRPQYAMKHLRPDLIPRNGDPEHFQAAAADLLMEAKYLAAFDHPGILKLRAVAQGGSSAFQSNGGDYDGFFIITDRLHGTLKDKIIEWQCQQQEESLLECLQMAANQQQQQQQQPRAWEEESKDEDMTAYSSANHGNNSTTYNPRRVLLEKVDLALQLAQALLYLHDRRLIYRDLKPQNIGLTKDNTVQLFDFGFCRELPPCNFIPFDASDNKDSNNANNEEEDDDLLYYMSGKGSLMYLAPEVLHNGRYNRKADCYSFAMVFYELLTLNKPFTTVTNQQIFRELIVRHKARPSLEFAEIPMPIQDLLRHAWNHSVSQRWTMKQICERLEEIMVDLKREEEQEARPVPASPSEQQHMIAPSSSSAPMCGGAGLVLDLVMDFARDVRLGFEILTGKHKTLALERASAATPDEDDGAFRSSPTTEQSDSVSVSPEDDLIVPVAQEAAAQERAVSPIERQGTAETVSSSSGSFSGASSLHVHVTPMTATEEPFEVTLEQAITMSPSHKENAQPAAAEDQRIDEHSSEKVMDERCPPSPPMERTASAPVNSHGNSSSSNGKTASMNVLGDIQVPYGRLPEEQQKAIMKPSRRQSYHGSGGMMTRGVLPAIPTPEKSRRRASSQGGKYADDGPQWISSVQAF